MTFDPPRLRGLASLGHTAARRRAPLRALTSLRPLRSLAWLTCLFAISAGGCQRALPAAGSGAVAVHYRDFVVDPGRPVRVATAAGIHTCADESHYSLELGAQESQTAKLTLHGPSELLVGGCVEGAAPGTDAKLAVRTFLPNGEWRDDLLALDAGWSRHRLTLAAEGGRVRLRLTANLPAGARLFLDSFAVRSEVVAEDLAEGDARAKRAILISLDAFREDAIGAVGGHAATPVLDRLLAESQRFTPSWSEEISTKPSHASILTGLPVDVHGTDRGDRPLRPEVRTLAERLAERGARTAAFMEIAPFFAEKFALNQGFETYRLSGWSVDQELRVAADWASSHRAEPSFLFVHLYGAHSDFGILPYEGRGLTRATVAERFGVADYGCHGESCASQRLIAVNYGAAPALAQEAGITRFLYDRGVETLDAQLGVFFDDLRRSGLWNDTLVVLTGDHGEAFGEHGYYLHTTPHEETLRVPLVVKWPRAARAGTTTRRFSTSLDIAPTVLAQFGLPADDLSGHDLGRAAGEGQPASRAMISKEAVRLGDLKLVFATREFPRALYDLALDPGERTNLLPARAADAARLEEVHRLVIDSARRRSGLPDPNDPKGAAQPFTAEELEQLRSLGYL